MLNNKMHALMREVNDSVAEREELIEAIAVALLTRRNLFILGDTGQAKSYAINEFRRRIIGAKQFERLLSKQADEEQLFGRIDLSSLIPGNPNSEILADDAEYQRLLRELESTLGDSEDILNKIDLCRRTLYALYGNTPKLITTGKIPDSHIVFLDEIFKANDGILNALLTALNERRFTNEGQTTEIPVISFFAASNEVPNFKNPEEAILRPLYDRLELKIITEYVQDRNARLRVLSDKQRTASEPQCTITLDELIEMQAEVTSIIVPDIINEAADDILCELREKKIQVSDRKYFSYAPLAQAMAWLRGAGSVEYQDLLILRHYLWTEPSEREIINQVLDRRCVNPLQNILDEIIKMGTECYADFEGSTEASTTKRIGKFRNEFLDIYGNLQDLRNDNRTVDELALLDSAVTRLEELSVKAHAASSFTYAPLSELFALQKTN
jgi:AAA domain (dynein-related subfamily).